MNILFICDEYPPGLNGGIGTMVQLLGRALVQQGHQVYVVGLYPYRYGAADYEMDHGVKVFRLRYGLKLPVEDTSRWYNLLEKLPDFIKRNLNGKKAFRYYVDFIQKIIAEVQIDIVEAPDWNTFAYKIGIKRPILPQFDIPLVLKLHGSYSYFSKELQEPVNKRMQAIDEMMWNRADAVIAVTNYTALQNNRLFQTAKCIKILYNAIPISDKDEHIKRSDNLVFFSGTLIKKKGILELIAAWNSVIKEIPNARLLIFGKGPTEPLKALLTNEAMGSVTFMGHQPHAKLMKCLKEVTVAVFPSFSETFGLAAIEAMSTGCPTIFTQRSCGPEIIKDGVTGLLVDPQNIKEITDKIVLLLSNEGLRNRIGVAGKQEVIKRFGITQSATDHIAFYKKVIQDFRMA